MPLQIPSYIQGADKQTQDVYRVLRDMAQFVNVLERTVAGLNNHVATGGAGQQELALTPAILKLIEQALESTGRAPLNVDGLPGQLLDPQGAGIPTASSLPDITTVGPGQAYFVGGILYIANNTVNPPVWAAITSDTSPQANHFALIGPVSGGPLTPTYRALVLSDLPALSGVTITSPTFATGIAADGSGFKHKSVTTGAIPASTTSDIDLTWTTTFANASYDPFVSLEDSSNQLQLVGIKSFTAAKITVTITNIDAGAPHTGTIYGLGIHI